MKRNKIRLWLYGLLTLAVMTLIFYMSARDGTQSHQMSSWLLETAFGRTLIRLLPRLTETGEEIDLRKYAHMAEYAMLAMPSAMFFLELLLERRLSWKATGLSLLFCFFYACSDEYHQTFVPGRAGTLTDVFVDLAGAVLGIAIVFLACRLRKELK